MIIKALDIWSQVAEIDFFRTGTAGQNMSLDFTMGEIDGPQGRLAEAYFPEDISPPVIAGDVQFDSSENWEVGNGMGDSAYDLMYVAVHEIGHALGLEHSLVIGSVMHPTVLPSHEFRSLHQTDVDELLDLYAGRDETNFEPPYSDGGGIVGLEGGGGAGGNVGNGFRSNQGGSDQSGFSDATSGYGDSTHDESSEGREQFFESYDDREGRTGDASSDSDWLGNDLNIDLGWSPGLGV